MNDKKTLMTVSVSAIGVWLITTLLGNILDPVANQYKWIALLVAGLFSCAGFMHAKMRIDFKLVPSVFFNGLLIFVTASGINAIHHVMDFRKEKTATLIPLMENASWWHTNEDLMDKIVPVAMTNSTLVAAGDQYEANLVMAMADAQGPPEFFVDDKKLSMQTDPATGLVSGKVSFTAEAEEYNEYGRSIKSYRASVKWKGTTYSSKIDYTVVKPTIRMTSGAMSALYLNCGNELNVEVPALGLAYNPTFTATGANVIKGDRPGRVTVIPKERKVTLSVLNEGKLLGTENFDIKIPPRPYIIVSDFTEREIDLMKGIPANAGGILVMAIPDESFKMNVPKDAVYQIKSMTLTLQRGASIVATINASTGRVSLDAWMGKMKTGDRIFIEIKSVIRKTFSGEEDKTNIANNMIELPVQ